MWIRSFVLDDKPRSQPTTNRNLRFGAKGETEPPWVTPPDPKSGASADSAAFSHLIPNLSPCLCEFRAPPARRASSPVVPATGCWSRSYRSKRVLHYRRTLRHHGGATKLTGKPSLSGKKCQGTSLPLHEALPTGKNGTGTTSQAVEKEFANRQNIAAEREPAIVAALVPSTQSDHEGFSPGGPLICGLLPDRSPFPQPVRPCGPILTPRHGGITP